jgi:hypothetical protein
MRAAARGGGRQCEEAEACAASTQSRPSGDVGACCAVAAVRGYEVVAARLSARDGSGRSGAG